MLKIAIIGGGSSYTPELIEGFINRHHELPIEEIWLVDIEEGKEKLEIVGNLAKRMVEKSGINCQVYLTLDREKAIEGANFIVTQLRVGQLDARIVDERIPLSHGMLGQETNGAGGFGKALRTIPVILDICKDIEKLAPNAWLINFTNPAGIITEAVLRYTDIKIVGLCNVPVGMRKSVANILKSDDFLFHMVGLNHYVWGKHVYYKGEDVLPKLLPELLKSDEFNPKNIEDIPFIEAQILATKMMPCPYHKYYYLTDDELEHQLGDYKNNGTRAEVVKKVERELFELYKDPNLKEKPKQLELRGGAYYSDAACELINGIYNDKRTYMVVNIENNGTINCLPQKSSIETTCLITNAGPIPLNCEELSVSAQGELRILKSFEQLTIEAALEGSYSNALQALTINPLVRSGKVAKTILDEILEANKEYLSNFSQREVL